MVSYEFPGGLEPFLVPLKPRLRSVTKDSELDREHFKDLQFLSLQQLVIDHLAASGGFEGPQQGDTRCFLPELQLVSNVGFFGRQDVLPFMEGFATLHGSMLTRPDLSTVNTDHDSKDNKDIALTHIIAMELWSSVLQKRSQTH